MKRKSDDTLNLFAAVVVSTLILIAWQFGYEAPRQKIALQVAREEQKQEQLRLQQQVTQEGVAIPRESLLTGTRIPIHSGTLHGSIALKGLRFDDLTLAKYRETIDPKSPEVVLLSPAGNDKLYFLQVGWLSSDTGVKLPDENSQWSADKKEIKADEPVNFTWNNGQGITFHITLTLDNHYMFTLKQQVENHSARAVSVRPYGFINRTFPKNQKHFYILHEGPLGVFDGVLDETTYQKLNQEKEKLFENVSGWFGVTDKYWLTAFVPEGGKFTAHFSYYVSKGLDRYQADYAGADVTVQPASSAETTTHLFAGAKELSVLDAYAKEYNIPLFDRAVDFGIYYILTKPMFLTLNYFYQHTGNFGIAILLLTILIKALMFPLANKSYVSMNQMKKLQPKLEEIKKKVGDDKMELQKEMMSLYKREKVNPASGCLPMLIQIPVFFSLYKVLFVTIEMRHAPFIGWIKDLSAPDPLNFFTLFGLIHWNPPLFMHLGVLPVLFCITMVIQQKLNPPPTDPTQAKVMSYMPFIFLFIFASFPAGLVIYWTWSNTLSILQQKYIAKSYVKKHGKH